MATRELELRWDPAAMPAPDAAGAEKGEPGCPRRLEEYLTFLAEVAPSRGADEPALRPVRRFSLE
jgi:hypothetical protein